jgi:hypothetical protein
LQELFLLSMGDGLVGTVSSTFTMLAANLLTARKLSENGGSDGDGSDGGGREDRWGEERQPAHAAALSDSLNGLDGRESSSGALLGMPPQLWLCEYGCTSCEAARPLVHKHTHTWLSKPTWRGHLGNAGMRLNTSVLCAGFVKAHADPRDAAATLALRRAADYRSSEEGGRQLSLPSWSCGVHGMWARMLNNSGRTLDGYWHGCRWGRSKTLGPCEAWPARWLRLVS